MLFPKTPIPLPHPFSLTVTPVNVCPLLLFSFPRLLEKLVTALWVSYMLASKVQVTPLANSHITVFICGFSRCYHLLLPFTPRIFFSRKEPVLFCRIFMFHTIVKNCYNVLLRGVNININFPVSVSVSLPRLLIGFPSSSFPFVLAFKFKRCFLTLLWTWPTQSNLMTFNPTYTFSTVLKALLSPSDTIHL